VFDWATKVNYSSVINALGGVAGMRLFGARGAWLVRFAGSFRSHVHWFLEEPNWPTEFVRGLAFIAESDADKVESKQCPNGGTGRRARFRTWFSQGSGGSSPLSGTMRIKAKARRILLHLLSTPRPVRFFHPLSGLPYSFRHIA
jgi:hypothetical protein